MSAVLVAIAVVVLEAQGVSEEDVQSLAHNIAAAVERQSGGTAVADDALWSDCEGEARCLAELRARTNTTEVVRLSAFATGARMRIVAERLEASADVASYRVQLDAPLARDQWPATTDAIARALYPKTLDLTPTADTPPQLIAPARNDREMTFAFGALGVAGAATTAAIILRVLSNNARSKIAHEPLPDDEIQSLKDRSRTQGLASNLTFGAAAVALTAGVVWIFADP